MKVRTIIGSLFYLTVAFASAVAGGRDEWLRSPESTVDTYYRGYAVGDRSIVLRTVLEGISDMGLGVTVTHAIVAKKSIHMSKLGHEAGDIEIVTHAIWRTAKAPTRTQETFFLRKFGQDWKIIGHFAELLPDHAPSLVPVPPSR